MKIPQTKRYSIYKNLVLQDERSYKINFQKDNRLHYVYRVIDLEPENNTEFYYGSRTSDRKEANIDFWKYGTSTKIKGLTKLIKENKNNRYKVKIVRIFNNPGDKILYEAFLHQYFDVKLHSKFWNKSNQTPFGFDTTGVKLSEEHKLKCSMPNIGTKRSEETKIRMSKAMKGINKTEEHKKNLSKAIMGTKLKENTKDKISKTLLEKHSKGLIRTTSKIILIFNQNNVIMYISKIKFESFCKLKNLPFKAFKKSYQRNGELLYSSKIAKTKAKNNGNEKYIGWYAKIKE